MNKDARKIVSLFLKLFLIVIFVIPAMLLVAFIIKAPSYMRDAQKSDYVSEIIAVKKVAEEICAKDSVIDVNQANQQLNRSGKLKKYIYKPLESIGLPQAYGTPMGDKTTYYLGITGKDKKEGETFFSASQAEYIDRKIDDGFPSSGSVIAVGSEECVNIVGDQFSYRHNNSNICAFLYLKLRCNIEGKR